MTPKISVCMCVCVYIYIFTLFVINNKQHFEANTEVGRNLTMLGSRCSTTYLPHYKTCPII
jgi:hypothetical protein